MNKVLIITYYWPPGSGAGVQRWLKFSKYLPGLGWEPIILTVDPEYAAYPVTDNSLTEDLPVSVKVHKTPAINYFSIYKKDKSKIPAAGFANSVDNTLIGKILRFVRGNFFIPDPRKGWNIFAFKKACEIIESEGIKHVITTSPPHSTQLTGLKIKKKYPGIKWIADLRDPWTDIYYYDQFYPTSLSKAIDRNFERQVLKSADRIITVGKSLKDLFSAKIPGIEDKIEVIPNGYDEEDFTGFIPLNPEVFTISYIGTLSDSYPVTGFMDALKNFDSTGYKIRLRFVGTVSPGQKSSILSKSGNLLFEFIPYVNHHDAIKYMMESSVLLLIIPDHYSNKSIITGKLFEYLASGKPILCIGPKDGDAADILVTTGHGKCAGYNDTIDISSIIDNYLKADLHSEKIAPTEFTRTNLTKKLVQQL